VRGPRPLRQTGTTPQRREPTKSAVTATTAASTTSSTGHFATSGSSWSRKSSPALASTASRSRWPAHVFFRLRSGDPANRAKQTSGCASNTGSSRQRTNARTSRIFGTRPQVWMDIPGQPGSSARLASLYVVIDSSTTILRAGALNTDELSPPTCERHHRSAALGPQVPSATNMSIAITSARGSSLRLSYKRAERSCPLASSIATHRAFTPSTPRTEQAGSATLDHRAIVT
jgi:hypothetical protein